MIVTCSKIFYGRINTLCSVAHSVPG
ncbi:hypothetical protein SNEBB_004336, partial [Seison nebaliae]